MTKPQEERPDVAELLPALAGLPRPELPPEVAARLDAAIVRAVAERAASGTGEPVSGPHRAPKGLRWRLPRVRLALGAITVSAVLVLAVSLAFHVGNSTSGSSAGPSSGGIEALSTAPVTDQALLSWADSILQHRVGPLTAHSESPEGQAQFGPSDPAVACIPSALLDPAGSAPRQLLSSVSGDYEGQQAELVAYTNGDDSSTAFIVVIAIPCRMANPSVLASGVVPR